MIYAVTGKGFVPNAVSSDHCVTGHDVQAPYTCCPVGFAAPKRIKEILEVCNEGWVVSEPCAFFFGGGGAMWFMLVVTLFLIIKVLFTVYSRI